MNTFTKSIFVQKLPLEVALLYTVSHPAPWPPRAALFEGKEDVAVSMRERGPPISMAISCLFPCLS